MERHNTHILSESQEDEEKDENNHFYAFNDADNSESNSLKNTIHSNSKKESKFSLNELIQSNNNEEKEIINDSLISSRDLEDVFYNEQRFIKKPVIQKDNDKINDNKDEKNKEADNVRIKMIKLNYDDNLSTLNEYLSTTPYLINRFKLKKIKKKRRCMSFENLTQKQKPKLKLSKKEENSKNNPKLSKEKKVNIPSKTDSNSNSDSNSSNDNAKKQKKIKSLYDILRSNNLKLLKISQNSFQINQEKNKECTYEEKMNRFKKKVKSMNALNDKLHNKIQKQNDFYFKKDYDYNSFKRNYFSPAKIKINGTKRFEILQIKDKENKFKHPEVNSRLIISNDNNSTYSLRYHNNSCSNQDYIRRHYNNGLKNYGFNENEKDICYNNFISNEFDRRLCHNYDENNYNDNNMCLNRMRKMNLINRNLNTRPNYGLKLKSDKKIKILYDLYCKKPSKEKKFISRINSAYSIKNRSSFKSGYNHLELNDNFENNDEILERKLNKESNNKNWLLKLLRIQKEKNTRHYEKHFGSNQSCPLCQQMDKKNEEQIRKIGIFHVPSDYKKTEEKNTAKKRRINSAYPNINIENNYIKENELINNKSNLHFNRSSALFNDNNLKKKLFDINQLNRKIIINKKKYMNSNFS